MKGQSSIEFLFMITVFLVVLGTFTVPYMINPVRDTSEKTLAVAKTRSTCDKLANSINGISGSGDNSVDSLGVSIPKKWYLETQTDPPLLKLTVNVEGESVTVKKDLKYGFNIPETAISPGYYTLTVQRKGDEGLTKTENRIIISLNPGV